MITTTVVRLGSLSSSVASRSERKRKWQELTQVVSMMSTPGYSRTALANPSGPFSLMMLRHPFWHGTLVSIGLVSSPCSYTAGIGISSCKPGSPC